MPRGGVKGRLGSAWADKVTANGVAVLLAALTLSAGVVLVEGPNSIPAPARRPLGERSARVQVALNTVLPELTCPKPEEGTTEA